MRADDGDDDLGQVEKGVRSLCEVGSYDAAATRTMAGYGREIFTFLRSRLGDQADAWDVFSMFSEDLWRGIPGFAWRCTLRAWAYTLARHAEIRFVSVPQRRAERNLSLSDVAAPMDAGSAGCARSCTAPYLRTEVKNQFRALRGRLGEEDQLILVLRVDRGLVWSEIAQVLTCPSVLLPEAMLVREGQRIRKRFQLIKERLRSWATTEGLLDVAAV